MINTSNDNLSTKKVLNLKEVVEYTGIKKSTIYHYTHTKKIPHSKPTGRAVFFDREKIDRWLLKNPVLTDDEKNSNY